MSITVNDPQLLDALRQADGSVELTSPDGTRLGKFVAEPLCQLPPGASSPFTEEQMAERRKDQTGRKLADILRDLQAHQ